MTQYTLRPEVVRDCVHRLMDETIHPTFACYLSLQQQSAIDGEISNLAFPYELFLSVYFKLADDDGKPFFIPFTDSPTRSTDSRWIGPDAVETYTSEPLPPTSPLMEVATVEEGAPRRWRLTEEHWKGARHAFCNGDMVPVESLAAFLLRDYAFETSDPSAITVVQAFNNEFGYQLGGEAFVHLYRTSDSEITEEAFERHE